MPQQRGWKGTRDVAESADTDAVREPAAAPQRCDPGHAPSPPNRLLTPEAGGEGPADSVLWAPAG